MKKSTAWETIVLCFIVSAGIVYLRLNTDYPDGIIFFAESITKMAREMVMALGLFEIIQFFESLPKFVILLLLTLIQIVIGLIFFAIFSKSMKQGSMILEKKLSQVIKMGLTLYFCFGAVIFIFIYSIIGIPLSIILLILAQILTSIGSVPLSIYIGQIVKEWIGMKGSYPVDYLFGSFVIMLCESVFGIGSAFLFFVVPILSMGTASILFIDLMSQKKSTVSNQKKGNRKGFDRDRIRNIIINTVEDEK